MSDRGGHIFDVCPMTSGAAPYYGRTAPGNAGSGACASAIGTVEALTRFG